MAILNNNINLSVRTIILSREIPFLLLGEKTAVTNAHGVTGVASTPSRALVDTSGFNAIILR
jgi:hypothetical protein